MLAGNALLPPLLTGNVLYSFTNVWKSSLFLHKVWDKLCVFGVEKEVKVENPRLLSFSVERLLPRVRLMSQVHKLQFYLVPIVRPGIFGRERGGSSFLNPVGRKLIKPLWATSLSRGVAGAAEW